MKIDRHSHGGIAWVNLVTRQHQRQVDFYTNVLGWEPIPGTADGSTVFLNDGEPVAGAVPIADDVESMPSIWSVHIAVDDIDDSVERVTDLGGKVFRQPTATETGGQVAVIGDPAGGVLCLIELGDELAIRTIDEPGAPCWFESMSRQAALCVPFYEQMFSWTTTKIDGANEYYVFGNGENAIAGLLQLPSSQLDVQSFWQTSFSIPGDIDTFTQRVGDHGAKVIMGPMQTALGTGAVVADPAGATFVAFARTP